MAMSSILKKIGEPSYTLLEYVVLITLMMYVLTPLLWLLETSVNTDPVPYLSIPKGITIDHFIAVLTNRPITGGYAAHPVYMTRWIVNSLIISGTTMIIVIVLAVLASYSLSRLRFRGKNLLMTIILLSGFMPRMAMILPLFQLCRTLGLVDNLIGVAIVVASGTLPTQIWILKGFFDQLPRDLEEQAWICGCDRVSAVFRVILPNVGPGLAVVAFMSFLSGWGAFTTPLILIRREYLFPISLGIASVFIHNPGEIGLVVDYGPTCALAVLYAIPSIALYILLRERLMEIRLARLEVR